MSKPIKTNKTGIFYREDSKKNRTYYYKFKSRAGKTVEKKVGSTTNGFTILMAVEARNEAIRLDVLGEDSKFTDEKVSSTLDEVAQEYFVSKAHNRNNRKEMMRYRNHIGFLEQFHQQELELLQEKIQSTTAGIQTRHRTDLAKLEAKGKDSFIGSNAIDSIGATHIKKLMDRTIENDLSAKSQDSILSLLSAILDFAIEKRYIQFNEVKTWRKNNAGSNPKADIDNISERYLSDTEIQVLYEAIEASNDDVRLFVHLGLKTGARASAIVKIKKKDIGANTITLWDEKRKKSKDRRYTIPLHPKLKELLQPRLDSIGANDTVIDTTYEAVNKQTSRIYMKLFNDGLNFTEDRKQYVSNHTLRHTFASQLALKEVSIYKIMKLMHHADIKMTERYAKLNPNENGFDELARLI